MCERSEVAGAQVLAGVFGLELQEGKHGMLVGETLSAALAHHLRVLGIVAVESERQRGEGRQLERPNCKKAYFCLGGLGGRTSQEVSGSLISQ